MSATMIRLERVSKRFGPVRAVQDVTLEIGTGRVRRPARPQRLRQDDAAPPDRRLRGPRRGHGPAGRDGRRRGRLGPAGAAARGHGLPGLRALPAPDRGAQRRLRAPAWRSWGARRRGARPRRPGRARRPLPAPALRRPAAARRARARARARAGRRAPGRALEQHRPGAPHLDARRARRHPARDRASPSCWSRTSRRRRSRSPTASPSCATGPSSRRARRRRSTTRRRRAGPPSSSAPPTCCPGGSRTGWWRPWSAASRRPTATAPATSRSWSAPSSSR